MDIEAALEDLIVLNPRVEWYWVTLNYLDSNENGHAHVKVELSLSQVPMRVDPKRLLIFK